MTNGYVGEQSTFNEGAGQMERINLLQAQINNSWINPLKLDIYSSGMYGYQIIFSNLNSLLQEVSSKLTSEELDSIISERDKVKKYMKEHLIHKISYDDSMRGRKKMMIINNKHWDDLEELLFSYGLKIRKLLEEHNMTAPKQKDPSKAIFGN